MLSKTQLQILGIEATKAYDQMARHDLLDLPAEVATCGITARRDFWRARICAEVTGLCSFREVGQDQYKDLLSRFQTLSGNTGGAYDSAHRAAQDAACHRAPGCEYVRDMFQWLAKAGMKDGYAYAILRGPRFKKSRLEDLSEQQLKNLHNTVVNRARAKLGLGNAEDRNKQQRQRRQQAAQDEPEERHANERTYILRPPPEQPF
jgi:hypothetical protein